jgi:hypothetical protein
MRYWRVLFVLGAVATALAGCIPSQAGRLTLVSTTNVATPMRTLRTGVVGRACSFSIVPDMGVAIAQAQRMVPRGNALANVTVEFEENNYIFLIQRCWVVEGDVVQLPGPDGTLPPEPERPVF